MIHRHGWFVAACLAIQLFCVAATAQEDDPRKQWAKREIDYISREALGSGVTLAEMSSGLTVVVQENHAAPVATVRCYVRNTGSAYEGPKVLGAGLSHVLEHLVSGGTNRKRTEVEIRKIIDSMGGQTNAYTSNEMTCYFIDCPAKRVSETIELVADSMQYVMFADAEYVREMGVVQRELQMGEADRDRMMYNTMKQLVYTEHPIRHPTIGYLPVLQSVARQDIVDFYHDRYVPQNMIFVVVGDVNTAEVLKEVLANFKNFQRGIDAPPLLVDEPDQASPRSRRLEMPGPTTKFSIAWPTAALQNPDLYPLDVASYLLTNGDSARLTKRLTVDEPLAVSVTSSSFTPGFVRGWFEVEFECKPENVEACRKIVIEEIKRLATELVDEKELAKVKRQKAAEHVFNQQTVENQAESIGRSFISTGDPLFDEQYVRGIQRVTPAQVQAVARKYFRPERENVVVIEPLGTGAKRGSSGAAQPAESEVIKKVLPNGLTLLVKRHAVQPLVTMQAFVKGGIIADTDEKSGRSALATAMMTKGTEKYTAEQIANFFDSVGGAITVSSQRNSSYMTCAVLKDDFPTALDFCHQVLAKPTFPGEEFKTEQELQLTRIARRAANPQTEIIDFWTTQLPEDTPYRRTIEGRFETVGKLTTADCKAFHKEYFVPSNMVIAVFGDIDPQPTIAALEARFGTQPKTKFEFPEFPLSHVSTETKTAVLKNQQQGTSMVLLSYPSVSVLAEKERSELEVLNSVLTGGGGSGGRLFEELRGAKLVYYVFGIEVTGLAPGYFLFLAQTQPESADEVTERIQANIERVRKEGIPADELALAKEKLIAGNAQRNTTPGEQAFQAALNELYGLGYDYDKGYDERINRVTSDEVQALVVKFFNHPLLIQTQPEAAE